MNFRLRKLRFFPLVILVLLTIVAMLQPIQAKTVDIKFEKTGIIATGTATVTDKLGYGLYWSSGHNWDYTLINGEVGFCIEPSIALDPASSYTQSDFTHAQREIFSRIIYHGYDRNPTPENYLLTLLTLWEYIASIDDNLLISGFENLGIQNYAIKRQTLMDKVSKHEEVASFNGSTVSLNVGQTLELIDTHNILKDSQLVTNGGLEVIKDQNKLIIKALSSSPIKSSITLKKFNDISGNVPVSPILYSHPTSQNVISKGNPSPVLYTIQTDINELGILEINKVDQLGNPIANVEFRLSKNADMTAPLTKVKTNDDGKVTIDKLVYGTYYLQEIGVPSPYIIDEMIHRISITAGETAKFTQVNQTAMGQIRVVKKSGDLFLANATFDILNHLGQRVETLTTNSQGVAISKQLPLGKYEVVETISPQGYVLDAQRHAVILSYANQKTALVTSALEVENRQIEGQIKVNKVDSVTGLPIENVSFDVLKLPNRDIIETITTDELGIAVTTILKYGDYVLVEKIPPREYHLSSEENTVSITKNNQLVELTVENNPVLVDLKIIKRDYVTKTGLSGVQFDLVDKSSEEIITKLITNELGEIRSDFPLPTGEYRLIETKPAKGYVTAEAIDFSVDRNTPNQEIVIEVENQKSLVEIHKVDIYSNPVEEALLQIIDAEDKVIKEWTSKKQAQLINGLEINKEYRLVERSAPKGYLVSDPVMFTVLDSYDKQSVIMVNEFIPTIETYATFTDGSKVSLAYSNVELIDTIILNKLIKGRNYQLDVKVYDVEKREQLLSETQTFVAQKEKQTVEVPFIFDASTLKGRNLVVVSNLYQNSRLVARHDNLDNLDQSVSFLDSTISTMAKPLKRSKEQPEMIVIQDIVKYENLKAGEEYELKGFLMNKATNAPLIINGLMVSSSEVFVPLEPQGEVMMKYLLDARLIDAVELVVFVDLLYRDDNLVSHYDLSDKNQTVKLKEVTVQKVDSLIEEKVLSGAEIGLFQDNILLESKITDELGFVRFVVEEGQFHLKELLAPKGYLLNDEFYEIDVTNSKDEIEVEIINELIEFPELPSTGSDQMDFVFLLASVIMVCAGVYLLKKKK